LGNNTLKTLTEYELSDYSIGTPVGQSLFCGFYLNELLQRLMPKGEVCEGLFENYQRSLALLTASSDPEPILRRFEFLLLQELGYAIDFYHDALTGEALNATRHYYLDVAQGFTVLGQAHWPSYSGQAIIAIADGDYAQPETRRTAKQLSRLLLKPLLGAKPLKSRELFAPLAIPQT
jgi:DNA repair protein RecO (recombination protein O)